MSFFFFYIICRCMASKVFLYVKVICLDFKNVHLNKCYDALLFCLSISFYYSLHG